MGGKIYTPFGAWYHATKFAFESFSDCLRLETKDLSASTSSSSNPERSHRINGIAADNLIETSGKGAYADKPRRWRRHRAESTAKRASSPEVMARTIVKAATARRPKTRYAVGFGAKPLIFTRSILSDRAYDAMILRISGAR